MNTTYYEPEVVTCEDATTYGNCTLLRQTYQDAGGQTFYRLTYADERVYRCLVNTSNKEEEQRYHDVARELCIDNCAMAALGLETRDMYVVDDLLITATLIERNLDLPR